MDQQSLIQIIADMGIEFVSSIQQSTQETVFHLRNGQLSQEQDLDWGFGFYMLHGLKDGYYSQNDFTRSTTGIVDIAKQLLRSNPSELVSGKLNPGSRKSFVHDISKEGPLGDAPDEKANEILNHLRDILNSYSDLNYNLVMTCKDVKKSIQNSSDNNIIHRFNLVRLTLGIYLDGSPDRELILEFGGIQNSDCNLVHISEEIKSNYKLLKELQIARKVASNRLPALLSPDSTFSLIHESIGHGCEADQVINNESFLSNKLGYKVGSSQLTITDDPHLRGVGWAEYDDEGTKTKGTLLVEDGILVDLLHSNKTSKIMGTPTTGNARATKYLESPETRQSNLFLEPKDMSVEEMIEDVKDGVYLGPSMMASTSIFTGEMYIQNQYGQLIKNGELTDYTRPITLAGNALVLLNKVKYIGSEITKLPAECLKSNSRLDIGGYMPHLLLERASIE